MTKQPADNTRVEKPLIIPIPKKPNITISAPQEYLLDADQVQKYKQLQEFYNNNFWGYGTFGRQTNYNPQTLKGQQAIQSNFDYAKSNAKDFATNLVAGAVGEGVNTAVKWATTPVKIGEGAEAVVHSAPLSTTVTKVSTIPRSEMHIRNMVPGALKATPVGSQNGMMVYTQPKAYVLSKEQISKAWKNIEKIMGKNGWKKITHPNLQGPGFTNGKFVVSDLGPGNIAKDLFGRYKLIDFSLETMPQFKLSILKRGGNIKFTFNRF